MYTYTEDLKETTTKNNKKKAFSNYYITRQVLQEDGRKGTTPKAKMQVPAAYPWHQEKSSSSKTHPEYGQVLILC